jgi:phosphonate transport system ATP-binding protein
MLEVRGVQVVYPNGYQALASIDLTARNGEIVALIGRSGVGKSTLLRTIIGIQRVTGGQILLDGKDISSMAGEELQDLR